MLPQSVSSKIITAPLPSQEQQSVEVGVAVGVAVGVEVAVGVRVGVRVGVGVEVGVGVSHIAVLTATPESQGPSGSQSSWVTGAVATGDRASTGVIASSAAITHPPVLLFASKL